MGDDRSDDPEPTGPAVLSWDPVDPATGANQLPPLWESAETDPYAAVTIPAAAPAAPVEPAAPNPISSLAEVPSGAAPGFTTWVSEEEPAAEVPGRRTWRRADRGPAPVEIGDVAAERAPEPPQVRSGPDLAPLPTYELRPVVEPESPGDPDDPVGARHAAAVPPWRRGLTAGALAVGAVVVGLVTANYWHAGGYPGHPANQKASGPGPAVVGTVPGHPSTHRATHPSTAPASGLPAPAGPASTAAATHAATHPSALAPSAQPSPHLKAGTATVTVLNETRIKDLGEKEAARIRAAGWNVRRTTNVNARYAVTTVFYDRTNEAQARLLMQMVPSIKDARLRPNIFLPTGGLIVVVASDAA
ncbi:MAG TPA: LytR C-terminal domain-containing protein [Mycobacteriales bacterium]|nr:LytR C-terminal domain-containing protein [Mycobacteriales bacterium]